MIKDRGRILKNYKFEFHLRNLSIVPNMSHALICQLTPMWVTSSDFYVTMFPSIGRHFLLEFQLEFDLILNYCPSSFIS